MELWKVGKCTLDIVLQLLEARVGVVLTFVPDGLVIAWVAFLRLERS